MASVGFGSAVAAAVAPASSSAAGRRRPQQRSVLAVPAATRAGQAAAAAKEEKSFGDFIFGLIFKENQLVETDPLLNKVDGGTAPRSPIPRAKTTRGGTTGGKKADDNGGGFNLGGLFAKKE